MNELVNQEKENIEKPRTKCLLIDDHSEIVISLGRLFENHGNFLAVQCHNLKTALEVIEKNHPKIIFLDNSLTPTGNEGFEIAKILKNSEPEIKIFSTTTNPYMIDQYEEMGITHINKSDFAKIESILGEN